MAIQSPSSSHQAQMYLSTRRKLIFWLLAAWFVTFLLLLGLPKGHSAPETGAMPSPSPVPVVTLNVPNEVMIGEDFTFEVKFDNSAGPVGYGPYIEVYLPVKGADSNAAGLKCDGISFQTTVTPFSVFTNPPTVAIPPTYTSTLSGSAGNLNCANPYTLPFAGMTPALPAVSGDFQLVVLELPFGSFDATQREITVKVTAHLSDYADLNTPLTIFARGGFRYGSDPLDNPTQDQLIESAIASAQTTPTVLKISKAYIGPEGETVTGPNYPRKYTITADIADTQPINDLVIKDTLPANLQYIGNLQVKIKGSPANIVSSCSTTPGLLDVVVSPPLPGPGGILSVKFCSPITGSVAPDDVSLTFDFFIPDRDANGKLIIQKDCSNAPVAVENDISATGNWDPLDDRDPSLTALPHTTVPVDTDLFKVDNVFQAKCLAIQKSTVTIVQQHPGGGSGFTPGDTLEYELEFQISDYFTIGKLLVKDYLGDGQNYLSGPTSTLTVSDQFGSKTGSFPLTTVTASKDEPGAEKFCSPSRPPQGGIVLRFDVSTAMGLIMPLPLRPRLMAGILTGGLAAGPPLMAPAIGKIKFRTKIRDEFLFVSNIISPKDKYVDKHDPINNCVLIEGSVYDNVNRPSPINAPFNIPSTIIGNANDTSKKDVTIQADKLEKSVYAVKRGTTFVCGPTTIPCAVPPAAPEVQPGDQVTFRIKKMLPSGDGEDVSIRDWLPLPIFNVAAGMTFNNTACTGVPAIPATGNACLGPTDTVHSLVSSGTPVFASDPTTNSFSFNYGNFNDPTNQVNYIDLLFTTTVTNVPFVDGLFLTNDTVECEGTTFSAASDICQRSIAQVKVREPKLSITKGVVATDNSKGVFKPALTPAGVWKPFGTSCPAFNPNITSSNLPGLINSDLSNVDAGDSVTFAIAIENTGGAPAYNVEWAEIMPLDFMDRPSCFSPDGGFCVTRGDGTPIGITPIGGGFGQVVFRLNAPLDPLNATTASTGTNIAIITFNAKLLDKDHMKPGCCGNRTRLQRYTSTGKVLTNAGNLNFVEAGFGGPFEDTATVCVGPKALAKCIVQTSEKHTKPQDSASGPVPLAIGEIARVRLVGSVPEGISTAFQVRDLLPPGLSYLGHPTVAFVSTTSGSITSSTLSGTGLSFAGDESTVACVPNPSPTLTFPIPSVIVGAADVTFNLGDLHNVDSDTNLELVVIEFNVLVNNVPSNQDGTSLTNKFDFIVDGKPFDPNNSISVSAVVVEPNITMTKTVAPNPAQKGQTLTYTVQYTNNGSADAFEVQLTDTLPSGLSPGAITASCPATVAGNVITMTCTQVPKAPDAGSTVILSYQAVANPQNCPAVLENKAKLTWTSLPGNGTASGVDNMTGSVTPGPTGTANGERDGITAPLILNDYATTASVPVNIECGCCANPPQGMVSWWPLTETSGATTVVDIMDGNNGSTRNNAGAVTPIGVVGGPNSILSQYVGNSLNFITSYVDVPNAANLNFGTGEFAIDAWVRVIPGGPASAGATIQAIVDKTLQPPGAPRVAGYALFVHHAAGSTAGRLGVVIDDGVLPPAASTPIYHPAPLSAGWHHVAVSVARPSSTSANVTLYADGVASPSVTIAVGSTSTSASLLIAKSRLLTLMQAGFREVTLDEIEIFNRAVTAAEIQSIFKAGNTGKCTAIIKGVKFNDLNGNGVRDTGEPGLGNWTISVADQNNNTHTTTTDASGNYSFTVPAGSYTVSEALLSGWSQTAPTTGSFTTAVSSNQTVSLDFGNQQKQKCDLTISKEVKPNPLISGQPATVIVTVTNLTNVPCHGPTTVTESLSVPPVSAGGPGWSCVGAVCTYAQPIYGLQSVSVTYNYNVTAQGGTVIKNCVKLKNAEDSNPKNDEACVEVKVDKPVDKCDLEIKKEVKPSPLISGQQASVFITLTNVSKVPCHGPTTVTESLPPVSAGGPGWICAGAVCTYPSVINAGASVSVTYTYNVTAQPGTVIKNCATLKNPDDSNPANDKACVDLKVDQGKSPDLTIKKQVQCAPTPVGIKCKIGFTITNNGPGTFNGLLAVQDVVTPIPSPFVLAPGSSNPPGWNCSVGAPGTIGCAGTSSVTLVPPGSTSFSLEVYVSPGAFKNCATVNGYTQPPFTASTLIQEGDFNNNESCVSMGSASGCVSQPANMIAWWPLNETASATSLQDIIGGNNGIPFASPVGAAQGPQPVPGEVGGAMHFPKFGNGLSGARVSPQGALANIGAANFTIDAWVQVPPAPANRLHYIVNKFDPAQNRGYALYVVSPGVAGNERLEFKWGDGTNVSTVQTISSLTTGQWHHVAVTFARNVGSFALDIRLYVDGAQQGQQTGNPPGLGTLVNFGSLEIGWQPGTIDEPITIDELEIFNRVLLQPEIQSIVNARSAGKCP